MADNIQVNIPDWLDEKMLKLAVLDGDSDTSEVSFLKYDVEPAVGPGNNYASTIFRVKVQYCINEGKDILSKSFIIKSPLESDNKLKDITDEANFTKNEYNVYMKILPKVHDISKNKFGPKTYFCQKEDVLVLEDLKEKNYKMCDRLTQLDYTHCKLLVKTLARYHAATIALHNNDPELIESNGNEPLYKSGGKLTERIWSAHKIKILGAANMLKKYEGMEQFGATLEEQAGSLWDKLVLAFTHRGRFNVLNHGDCWLNNIMFKYDESEVPVDCKLIDFQIRRYGSPAVDLIYFMFTSLNKEVREKHMNNLVKLYHEQVNGTLVEFSCSQRLSLEDLQEDLFRMCPWAIVAGFCYFPYCVDDSSNVSLPSNNAPEDLESVDIDINPHLLRLRSKIFKEMLPVLCTQMISFGVLKYLTQSS